MTPVAALLIAASIAFGVSRATRAPPMPLLLASGVALRWVYPELSPEMVEDTLSLGLTFLLFSAGAELDQRRIQDLGPAVLRIGLGQFFGLGALAFVIATFFGVEPEGALVIGLAGAASSSLVATRLLRQRQQYFEPFGRITLGVLLLQTVLVLLALAGIARYEEGLAGVESGVLRAVGLGFVAWVASRTLTPWLLVQRSLDDESALVSVMAMLFTFLGLAWIAELPLPIGAFCAGYALSPFPANGLVANQLDSLRVFFLALFFTALGADLSLLDTHHLMMGLVLSAAVLGVTPLWVMWLGRRASLTRLVSIETGLLLAQTSEISLVIGLFGRSAGLLNDGQFSALALCAVITMGAAPAWSRDTVAHWILHARPFRPPPPTHHDLQDHVVMLGCGPGMFPTLQSLIDCGEEVAVIDDDAGVVEKVRRLGAAAVHGDASDPKTLDAVSAKAARVVISTLRRPTQHRRIVTHLHPTRVVARVFSEAEAAVLRPLGGETLTLAEVTAEDFLAWFQEHGPPPPPPETGEPELAGPPA